MASLKRPWISAEAIGVRMNAAAADRRQGAFAGGLGRPLGSVRWRSLAVATGCLAVLALLTLLAPWRYGTGRDEWLGLDKAFHLSMSAVLAVGVYALARAVGLRGRACLGLAVGVSISAGLGKEIMDALGYGTASYRDACADVLGSFLGAVLARRGTVRPGSTGVVMVPALPAAAVVSDRRAPPNVPHRRPVGLPASSVGAS